MHTVTGTREPADYVGGRFDDAGDRRQANRAVGVSAVGLAVTGLVELGIAVFTGSVGLLGDALHNPRPRPLDRPHPAHRDRRLGRPRTARRRRR